MIRLLIHVEGQSEESFVNELLAERLLSRGYASVGARLLGNARQRNQRGGARGWRGVKKEIINHLRGDRACVATTMVDFYGLPFSGENAWPGTNEARNARGINRAKRIEAAMEAEIRTEMGGAFHHARFVAFVVMHEFEGLLFSDCGRFAAGIERPDLAADLQSIRDAFASPEEIDDSPETAPSKRVERIVSGYQKPLHGVLAAREIGLDRIRAECPHFNAWMGRLEASLSDLVPPGVEQ